MAFVKKFDTAERKVSHSDKDVERVRRCGRAFHISASNDTVKHNSIIFMQFTLFQCPSEWPGEHSAISVCRILLPAHRSSGEIRMPIVSSGRHITHHTHHCLHNCYRTAAGQRNLLGDALFDHNLYDCIDIVLCLWSLITVESLNNSARERK